LNFRPQVCILASGIDMNRTEKTAEPSLVKVLRTFGEPRFHTDSELTALAYGHDGSLWSIEEAGWLRQWHGDGRQVKQLFVSDLDTLWVFSGDATWLASASDDLTIWDSATGSQFATIQQLSWVTAMAFSPDKKLIATGHDDGRVQIWETETQELRLALREHKAAVSALAFSPSGDRLAIAGEDRLIQIIDLAAKKRIQSLAGHTDRIPALAWHADGNLLASAGWDTTARLWDAKTGQPILLLNSHSDQVQCLAFSPDGSLLAVADSDHVIHVWDKPTSGKTLQVLHGHTDDIRFLTFSPDGSRLASAGNDQSIHIWDPRAGKLLAGQNAQTKYAISASNTRLASTCGGTCLSVWDLASGKEVPPSAAEVPYLPTRETDWVDKQYNAALPKQTLIPTGIALSPNGHWLIAGGEDSLIHVWELGTKNPPFQLRGHWGPVGVQVFSADSNFFASACATDGTCWVWKMETCEPFLLITEAVDGCSVEAVAFHPNSRWVACGGIDWLQTRGADGAICLWDYVDRNRLFILEGGVSSLAFHPNGRWLAGASLEEFVTIWDVTDSQAPPIRLSGHQERARAVAFSPNGRWLVSTADDRTLRLWDGETFELEGTWRVETPVRALTFSPDGQFLFTANANTTCSQVDWNSMISK
jgi:WD40 repeat protein